MATHVTPARKVTCGSPRHLAGLGTPPALSTAPTTNDGRVQEKKKFATWTRFGRRHLRRSSVVAKLAPN